MYPNDGILNRLIVATVFPDDVMDTWRPVLFTFNGKTLHAQVQWTRTGMTMIRALTTHPTNPSLFTFASASYQFRTLSRENYIEPELIQWFINDWNKGPIIELDIFPFVGAPPIIKSLFY